MQALLPWIPFASLVLTLTGWVVSHALSLRAQRKHLLNQAYNSSRLEIAAAIRDYQDWIAKLSAYLGGLPVQVTLEKDNIPVNWARLHGESIPLFEDRAAIRWLLVREEYEILFPATREVRYELATRHGAVSHRAAQLCTSLLISHEREEAIAAMRDLRDPLMDMTTLLEDVRVYVQNVALGSITGNAVPFRQPPDPTVPRIIVDRRGRLSISTGEGPDNNQMQV